jgi:hypothetical protein
MRTRRSKKRPGKKRSRHNAARDTTVALPRALGELFAELRRELCPEPGPEQLAFRMRLDRQFQAFQAQVHGATEPWPNDLLYDLIADQLWEHHGTSAHWSQLDMDALLDDLDSCPATLCAEGYITLHALLTWLANTGALHGDVALRMIDRVLAREPDEVQAMRAVVGWCLQAAVPSAVRLANEERDRRRFN